MTGPQRAAVGMCFDRTFPAARVVDFARALDQGGAEQLWIIEDCFYTAGISLAATALAVTEHLTVGLGILPAVVRNPAITAMEIATLAELAPGRLVAGIGHGVQSWMAQIGERTPSPLTALEEVLTVLRRLLAGETVTFSGRQVTLDDVALNCPPAIPPPLLAGVQGPKSLALAGRIADGVVLAEPAGPAYVHWALEHAGRPTGGGSFDVAVFSVVRIEPDRVAAYQAMAPWLGRLLDAAAPALQPLPFLEDLKDWYRRHGLDGLVRMPVEWWNELGPIGTLDDAAAHIEALEAVGVGSVALFPQPDLSVALAQLPNVVTLANR
jgi:5,10-methylenetetrahydromethanopterin reductase